MDDDPEEPLIMRTRTPRRLVATAGLALATVLTAAACAPDTPPAPSSTTSSTTSTTTSSTTSSTTTSTTTTSTVPAGPTAAISVNPSAPAIVGAPLAFSAAGSTGTGLTYKWDFTNAGQTDSTSATPTYRYKTAGTFTAKLTVTDAGAATATATVSVTVEAPPTDVYLFENPVAVGLNQTKVVGVAWKNQDPNKLVFVDLCRKSKSDPTFNVALDCGMLSTVTANGTALGVGAAGNFEVFRGEDPAGDSGWGCFAAGDTAPAGVQKNTTCFVRVTNDSQFNNDDAKELAFTVTAP